MNLLPGQAVVFSNKSYYAREGIVQGNKDNKLIVEAYDEELGVHINYLINEKQILHLI